MDRLTEAGYDPLRFGSTIDAIYADILKRVKDAESSDCPHVIWIAYNQGYHYPEKFFISPMSGFLGAVSGAGFEISRFEVLDGIEEPEEEAAMRSLDWKRFTAEKTAWKKQGLSHYRFTVEERGVWGADPPVTVTVFPDREPEITDAPGELALDGAYYTYGSIDVFYAFIAEAAAAAEPGRLPLVRYNSAYHYPEVFNQSGDGYFIEITRFEVLP
jgi:hypothetical protein